MCAKGLEVSDFEKTYEMMLRINRSSLTSRHGLKEFLEIRGADQSFLDVGLEVIYERPPFEGGIQPVEGAKEILSYCARNHQLALVTIGQEIVQRKKLMLAGIDSQIFSQIFVCSKRDKKPYYKKLIEELGFTAGQVIVCGDRISIDLAPAKDLGCKTVHFKWGRGLGNTGLKRDVDYTILHLRELKTIIMRENDKE